MMLKSRADFTKRARLDEKTIAAATARVEREIARVYRSYIAIVKALVRDPDAFSRSQRFDVAVLIKTQETLTQALVDAGRDDLLGTFLDEFAPLTKQARGYFKEFGDLPKLGGSSAEALDAYIDFSERRLTQIMDQKLVGTMQEALFQATFGQLDRNAVIDTVISTAENLTEAQAATLVEDTFRQYQRAVTVLTADELGMEVFWYQGPDDERTSDQCESILNEAPHGVPGMYYRDEISKDMHPDLEDDPFVAGGHFNCRHKFYPITLEFAKSMGFKP